MDVKRFDAAGSALLKSLGDRLPPNARNFAESMLSAGEWQFFADEVAGALSRRQVSIDVSERDLLRELLYAFEPDEISPEDHRSLLDRDEVMASLNVVPSATD